MGADFCQCVFVQLSRAVFAISRGYGERVSMSLRSKSSVSSSRQDGERDAAPLRAAKSKNYFKNIYGHRQLHMVSETRYTDATQGGERDATIARKIRELFKKINYNYIDLGSCTCYRKRDTPVPPHSRYVIGGWRPDYQHPQDQYNIM